jgi:2-C-methyl-D-erythritol 2,4-cyclodiphosphate synthase
MIRIGIGYDIHRLAKGRKLFLGGVNIPYSKGALAYSDGDVVLHAICDAILGALGKGDIGEHFPDSQPRYKGISSLRLLEKTVKLMRKAGYRLNNLDVTLLAQAPRVAMFKEKMREKIASAVHLDKAYVNIKATTSEGSGDIGAKKAIACWAAVLLWRNDGSKK